MARALKKPEEGMIARTAAQWASDEELDRDYRLLVESWDRVCAAAKTATSPRLVYKAMGLVQTVLRDWMGPDITEVVVDSPFFFEKIESFLEYMQMADQRDKVRLHKGPDPLFAKHDVERQIQDSLARRVPLAGGGSIVIDETEALIAIDVNTGGDVRHRNQSAAILNTNLEAATEIARQLRLRQISGIIVVDFVDMEDPTHVQQVIEQGSGGAKEGSRVGRFRRHDGARARRDHAQAARGESVRHARGREVRRLMGLADADRIGP